MAAIVLSRPSLGIAALGWRIRGVLDYVSTSTFWRVGREHGLVGFVFIVRGNCRPLDLSGLTSFNVVMVQCTLAIGLGLALTTHSPLVVVLASLAGLVWWMGFLDLKEERPQTPLGREIVLSFFLVGVMVTLRGLNGLVPLQ